MEDENGEYDTRCSGKRSAELSKGADVSWRSMSRFFATTPLVSLGYGSSNMHVKHNTCDRVDSAPQPLPVTAPNVTEYSRGWRGGRSGSAEVT